MASEEWFESWFDSPLYEQLYAHRDDTEAEQLVSWISENIPPHRFPDVLDMGCGRGRHSVMLAEQGYQVTGVDLSPRAVEKAQKRAEAHKLENVGFEIGDMRTWHCEPFDLVCNLFTSFGYFEQDKDNRNVIENMSNLVRKNGFLVLDYLNEVMVRRNLIPEENVSVGDLRCYITRKIERNTIVKTIHFNHEENKKKLRFQERVQLYGERWFREVFNSAGLTISDYLGDYNGSLFIPEYSPRLLIVARK